MNKDRIYYLHQQYLDGKQTGEEALEWEALLEELWQAEDRTPGMDRAEAMAVYAEIITRPQQQQPRYLTWTRIAVAASVLFMLSVGGYFILHRQTNADNVAVNSKQDFKPGSNGAILTLANGQKIVLEQAKKGILAKQNGSKINKANDSLLIYQANNGNSTTITYNTLETPIGKQYSVVLPDGSKAWLNAASSLKYPTAFTGKERLVELTGEAYFEVVHDAASPFRVKSGSLTIEDIGTHFNINNYDNEPIKRTTLLEGSVRVNASVLKPGEEAAIANDHLTVKAVDAGKAIAWKQGYFYFDHAGLNEVMRQFARWYDMDVVYEGTIPPKLFKGKVYRNVNASQALKILAFFNVHFKIDGKKVIINN